MSNTPSEELRLLLQEARSALWQPANAELCERIDDALARWGTPQPVVREPFCYVSVDKQGDITRMLKWKDKWTNIPLYTAPQPAQVQPVVLEPLSDAQIKELIEDGVFLGNCKEIVRAIEHAHGITQKGGSMALSDERLWDLWNAQGTDDMSKAEAFTFARTIEAEVRKQDDALIQQMKEVLESLAGVKLADGSYADKDCGFTLAITAAKLRLGD